VKGILVIPQDLSQGDNVLKGKISYQACSASSCLPRGLSPFPLTVRVVPPGSVVTPSMTNLRALRESGSLRAAGFGDAAPAHPPRVLRRMASALQPREPALPSILVIAITRFGYFGGKDQSRAPAHRNPRISVPDWTGCHELCPGVCGLLVGPDGRSAHSAPGGSCFHGVPFRRFCHKLFRPLGDPSSNRADEQRHPRASAATSGRSSWA